MAGTSVRNPSQGRAIRTRAALVAAAELEFSDTGYAQTTARSIALRAGVATGTFYQYFSDKDVLLRELAQVRQARIASESASILGVELDAADDAGGVLERIERSMSRVVQLVVDYHRENPGLHAVLTERRHADPELDELTAQAEALLVTRSAELLRRSGFVGDVDATAFVLFGMVEGSAHAHVLGKAMVSDQRFTQALVGALIRVAFPGLQPSPSATPSS